AAFDRERRADGVASRRKATVPPLVVVKGGDLVVQVAVALGAACRLSHLLDGWQEHADEQSNDGNDNEQFNQGEAATPTSDGVSSHKIRSTDPLMIERPVSIKIRRLQERFSQPTRFDSRGEVGRFPI